MNENIIIIIPARGGSKGIPRKNLRPLNGKPLIYYSIKAALESDLADRVVVSSEDDEILLFAKRFGAEFVKRPKSLSGDEVTIDPVVLHAVKECEKKHSEQFGIVLTVQPTSPLLSGKDIDAVIRKIQNNPCDTVITVTEDRHLRWKDENGKILPLYEKRINRQLLPYEYKETGGIIACRKENMEKGSRIGEHIELQLVNPINAIDIDSFDDFWLCERILNRKKIVITVTGNDLVGLGHVYRTLLLANDLVNYEVIFVCKASDDLAIRQIRKNNYTLIVSSEKNFFETINGQNADMVINDILDTTSDFIESLKQSNHIVINFEDLGSGSNDADLVINALYPHSMRKKNILTGPRYFCLRDEFLHIEKKKNRSVSLKKILITFGGVDEGNLTCRTLKIFSTYLKKFDFTIDIVLGPGFKNIRELENLRNELNTSRINIIHSTSRISEYMNQADLAVTSAGRTVFELASLTVPTIVICQNLRETSHTFAVSENGFINLGLHSELNDKTIHNTIQKVFTEKDTRSAMIKRMMKIDLKNGKKTVIEKIISLLK